ncbi:LytTR family DNA-binding domain-containing protein [Kordiimonas marina]|uniref:LytTR family DNA-binding domain-containing protein n=1 Tax=Kordiimonas marina TaxID=2872312 RepID=UPI001FF1537F|nr:LytTR family DNA-binding domain-containing protein [Kordiimonas marina]MCJ9428100.1 LytTR family transcriptional regulator DNA-binding domain-containing protein [Kordiimonas marina]
MIGRALKAYIGTYRRHVAFVVATVAITAVFTAVNSASVISDYARLGQPIAWGKPVMFETTSALAILIMLPLIIRVGEVWPPTRATWLRQVPRYILASLIFSAGHVTLMVIMRQLLYTPLFGGSYDFFRGGYGAIPYEYWKDLRTFVLLTGAFFLLKDAMAGRAAKKGMAPIELRSGATRILLDPAEFLYAKAAANYAEIITLTGESLARITLKELEEKLKEGGVQAVRVHRSMLVNRAMIQTIDPLPGGDMKLALKGGHTLRASRRYKAGLDQ